MDIIASAAPFALFVTSSILLAAVPSCGKAGLICIEAAGGFSFSDSELLSYGLVVLLFLLF